MLETVKKPQFPQKQPPQLWSLGRLVQMGLAGFAFLYLWGYGLVGHQLLSRSPAYQADAPGSSSSDTDDALVVQP
jgi:hypothetical protein